MKRKQPRLWCELVSRIPYTIKVPLTLTVWHDVWHSFLCVWVWVSVNNPIVCFVGKPPQRACARDLPQDQKRTREGRSQRQSAGDVSQKKDTVKKWEQGRVETRQQKSERRLLGPVDLQMPGCPTREDESAFLVASWRFARTHACDSQHTHGGLHKSVTDFSFLALGAKPSPWFCSFFSTLSVVFVCW